nr:methyl-accepting chemotaxis protein [uncultured Desulfobulbus sp.]
MKYTTKLFCAVVVLCISSIIVISGNGLWMSEKVLNTLGKDALEHMHEAVFNSLASSLAGIDDGLAMHVIRNNGLVGVAVVLAAILITFLLVRMINRPLQELVTKSILVGEGDYFIIFASENKDAIGQLTRSLGIMVTRAREMMGDIIQSSEALTLSAQGLRTISEQMVSNADATNGIAGETARNANEVSDNMTSISATMEQSTTNLDMIASASEEMGTTINEIAENSARARVTTGEVVNKVINPMKECASLARPPRPLV